MNSRIFFTLILVLLALSQITGCNVLASKPTVTITAPPSGSTFREGDDVAVQSVSTDSAGIVRVELLVDGTTVRTDPSPIVQGQPSLPLVQNWKATQGTHTLMVRAYNTAGAVSEPVAVSVSVAPAATPTATRPAATLPTPPTIISPSAPSPTATGAATCTNNAAFVADVTVPDGTVLAAGQTFNKIGSLGIDVIVSQ